jgi:GxxExxY protein
VEKELEPIPETVDRIATQIVDACFHLHSRLGPGLLESVYETCLAHELAKRGLRVERQVPIPIIYDDLRIEAGFKIDLLVEGSIILEIKAATEDHPVFKAQLLTYMKLTGIRLGFLINFNKKLIKDGIQRVAL